MPEAASTRPSSPRSTRAASHALFTRRSSAAAAARARDASSMRAQRLLLHMALIESAVSAPARFSESWHASAPPPLMLHLRLTAPSRDSLHSSSMTPTTELCSVTQLMRSQANPLSPARAVHAVALHVSGTVGQPVLSRAAMVSGQLAAVPSVPSLASHAACSSRQPTCSVPTSGSSQVAERWRSKAAMGWKPGRHCGASAPSVPLRQACELCPTHCVSLSRPSTAHPSSALQLRHGAQLWGVARPAGQLSPTQPAVDASTALCAVVSSAVAAAHCSVATCTPVV
mmetsp:Transcript_80405/g.194941  ORF Transcript_80405/g.194941 Transcript_80405/m.194941 type:complete len:285 (+) Transcript_80405:716-1570(+)